MEALIQKAQEQVKEEQKALYKSTLEELQPVAPMDDEEQMEEVDPITKFYTQADESLERTIKEHDKEIGCSNVEWTLHGVKSKLKEMMEQIEKLRQTLQQMEVMRSISCV